MFDLETDSNTIANMSPESLSAYVLWATEQIIEPVLNVAKRQKLRQRRALAESIYLKKKGAK